MGLRDRPHSRFTSREAAGPLSAPKRIQLRRTQGWRKPEEAVVVARPSRWGNPYRLERMTAGHTPHWAVSLGGRFVTAPIPSPVEARREAVMYYEIALLATAHGVPSHEEIREHLGGRDLCCWCPLDQPCHADGLLEVANS